MLYRAFLSLATLFFWASFSTMLVYAKPFKVVTTFTVIADMARQVAGDAAEVASITKPGAEIHGYQPTPRDILRAQKADLILWNGMGLEAWFKPFFAHLQGVPEVTVSQGVDEIPVAEGGYFGKPNPHAWMSLQNARVYITNIRDALVRHDADNAAIYQQNATQYLLALESAYAPLKAAIAQVPAAKRWLVTSEGAFSYLARDLNLKEVYLWPMNADQIGTPQQVRKVIEAVREHNIPVVFSESTVSAKPMQQVARETGADYGGVLYVDSLSQASGPVPSYLELLRVTTQTIVNGFRVARE